MHSRELLPTDLEGIIMNYSGTIGFRFLINSYNQEYLFRKAQNKYRKSGPNDRKYERGKENSLKRFSS